MNRTSSAIPTLAFAAGITLVCTFGIGLGSVLVVRLWPRLAGSLVPAVMVESLVYGLAALWLARQLEPGVVWTQLGVRRAPVLAQFSAAMLGVALHGPVDFVEMLVERRFPLPDPVIEARARQLLVSSAAGEIGLLLAVAVLIPVVEELFFRGALWASLLPANRTSVAACLTALFFTISHAEPRSWPALSLVAAALGLLRVGTASILPCVLLHASFNATTLLVIFAHPDAALGKSVLSLPQFLLGTAISVGLLLLVFRPRSVSSEAAS